MNWRIKQSIDGRFLMENGGWRIVNTCKGSFPTYGRRVSEADREHRLKVMPGIGSEGNKGLGVLD